MALLRKFFFRKPPDWLLEICGRVYGAFFYVSGLFLFFVFLFVEMMKMIGEWRIVNGQKVEDSYFVCACVFGF
jgi:hypothetical protein